MFRVLIAGLLIAQTVFVPMTGARTRDIQTRTLFHTLFHDFFLEDDGTTYVQTGDIPAMWLRDSSAQVLPYIRFQRYYPILRARFAGVIERDARAIDKDVYANAFQEDYHTWERKWEVDSIAWPVILAYTYVRSTGDRSIYTPNLHVALKQIVYTYRCEAEHSICSRYVYPYHVATVNEHDESTGLIWCAFRPSDDPVQYRFNIPQNIIAAIALRNIATLAREGYHDEALAQHAELASERLVTAILRYGVFYNVHRHVWMYAYETDGNGHFNLMDDANLPNLTTIPELGWLSNYDPVYLNTRAFALSDDDPYYYQGRYAEGLGSPHTPSDYVWPLGIMGQAITSTDDLEIENSITTLAETDSEDGLIHESFYASGYWRYTRQEFGWANALYAELIFRTLAGFRADRRLDEGTMLPFQQPMQTPVLVSRFLQLENTMDMIRTLRELLYEGRAAAINQAP
jgi:meiotically up-regulated gene 157 (Mug157) protein